MDYKPNQINRMLQLGYKEKILNSSVIWLCVGCQMCVTRCPMQLNIPKIMDILRELALKERVHIKERNISLFYQQFLNSIKRWGRVYELELIVLYKLKSNTLFQDIELGKKMFSKGKLNLLPDIAGTSDVKKIFNRSIGR
jgi:heterodisulfide reductase subunit C